MSHRKPPRLTLYAAILCVLFFDSPWTKIRVAAGEHDAPPSRLALVIEEVAKNSEGQKGGVKKGDIVRSWLRGEARGDFESPFDLSMVEVEQAPRGAVTLQGQRGEEERTWVLGQDSWGIRIQPDLPNEPA